jgi:hypothetical protein
MVEACGTGKLTDRLLLGAGRNFDLNAAADWRKSRSKERRGARGLDA